MPNENENETLDAELLEDPTSLAIVGCPNPDVPSVDPINPDTSEDGLLQVIPRYKSLMSSSMGEESLYERAKKSIFELSKEFNMTEAERMEIVSGQITQMTVNISGSAMQTALSWAKEDASVGYATALIKSQAEGAKASAQYQMAQICKSEKDQALVCAQIEATIAGSIRENGRVAQYDTNDPCKPISLKEEGLNYEKTLQTNAATYNTLADAYRKSGKVSIGIDGNDQMRKGLGGDNYGHTVATTNVAHRQIASFEDSKRNHAVNASSQTIGQIIAAEAALDPQIVDNYNKAMNYLLTDSPTSQPGGPATLSPVTYLWNESGVTDMITFEAAPNDYIGEMTVQQNSGYMTFKAVFEPTGNTRNGDNLVININGGEFFTSYTLTTADITAGFKLCSVPSVVLDVAQATIKQYDINTYIQDYSGNKSVEVLNVIKIKYLA